MPYSKIASALSTRKFHQQGLWGSIIIQKDQWGVMISNARFMQRASTLSSMVTYKCRLAVSCCFRWHCPMHIVALERLRVVGWKASQPWRVDHRRGKEPWCGEKEQIALFPIETTRTSGQETWYFDMSLTCKSFACCWYCIVIYCNQQFIHCSGKTAFLLFWHQPHPPACTLGCAPLSTLEPGCVLFLTRFKHNKITFFKWPPPWHTILT